MSSQDDFSRIILINDQLLHSSRMIALTPLGLTDDTLAVEILWISLDTSINSHKAQTVHPQRPFALDISFSLKEQGNQISKSPKEGHPGFGNMRSKESATATCNWTKHYQFIVSFQTGEAFRLSPSLKERSQI